MKILKKLTVFLVFTICLSSVSLAKGNVIRYSGKNREEVAVKVSKEEFSAAKSAILVNSRAFPDALSASIVSQGQMPILFSSAKSLDSKTRDRLEDFDEVIILGGKDSVSVELEKSLKNNKVRRIAGKDRYETNLKAIEEKYTSLDELVVATGLVHADALYGISYANKVSSPILLVKDDIEKAKGLIGNLKVKNFTLIGGSRYLPDSIEESLKKLGNVKRIAGKDRYEGSIKVLEEVYGSNLKEILVANGDNFADPLVAGPVSIKRNAPIVLTRDGDNSNLENLISDSSVETIIIFGGRDSVSSSLEEKLQRLMEEDSSNKIPVNSEKDSLKKELNELISKAKNALKEKYSPSSLENLEMVLKEVEADRDKNSLNNLSKNIEKLKDALNKLDKAVEFGDENVKEFLLDYFKSYDGNDVFEYDMNEYGFKLSDKSFRKDSNSKEIYESEMKLITDLRLIIYDEDFNWMDIKSIKGIETATNLENLTISSNAVDSSNAVSDISDLKNLKKLKNLRLAHNAIVDMSPLGELDNLEKLYISHNQIEDISTVTKLPKLKVLDISVNKIEDISPVKVLKNLEELDGIRNNIKDISPVKDLVKLERLAMAENKIVDLSPLRNLTDLTYLNLYQNDIQSFKDLEGLEKLETLDLRKNNGKDFDVSKLVNLQDLNINDNPELKLTGGEKLINLTSLQLKNTGLDDISFISPLTKLEFLDISNNKIEDISMLKDLTKIYALNISENKVKDISVIEKMNLDRFYFNANQVSDLNPLKGKEMYAIEGNNQVISGYEVKIDGLETIVDSPFKGLDTLAKGESITVETEIEGLIAQYNPETDKLVFKTDEKFNNNKREIDTTLTYKVVKHGDYFNEDYIYKVENFKIIVD
ncbi:cell wall-binding repeat-containing protein [Lagierella sp.]|uniref:cell wall-binding repeat-containing protein n=1 Tax=Lagierella sp. TaxID=2849657 RepID=UPI0026329246|nr:cell wall-binding repeat-containing protein [Lagierella sp.]